MVRMKVEIQRDAWNNEDSNNNNLDQHDVSQVTTRHESNMQKVEPLLIHDGKRASIITSDICEATQTPWTPKALGRAKSAFIYKQCLNDTLLIMERNILFFADWTPYFVSLQQKHLVLYTSREKWEQGLSPDKVVKLTKAMMLGDMKVENSAEDRNNNNNTGRLFRRRILEVDNMDEWVNLELQQGLVIGGGSNVDATYNNNSKASTHCVLEFATTNQNTFELWTKAIRRVLQAQIFFSDNEVIQKYDNNEKRVHDTDSWVSPGRDSRLSLHQSEIWCQRVLSEDRDKAESEMRRIVAMEKLISQVTSPRMALLVYEKVSRVHELFIANSRREIERLDGRQSPISSKILNFFADHLKRKYSVFLNLALAYGNHEEQIRQAHETMCRENASIDSGIGGGDGEIPRAVASYGFEDEESIELYEKYRDAAQNYYRMNYGESATAEEEDAVMHLPVMLQVSIIRKDEEERRAMSSILRTVKQRLQDHSRTQENETH